MRVICRNEDGNLEALETDRIYWDSTKKKLFIQSDSYYDISCNDPRLTGQYENIMHTITSVGYVDLSAYQFKIDDPEYEEEDE